MHKIVQVGLVAAMFAAPLAHASGEVIERIVIPNPAATIPPKTQTAADEYVALANWYRQQATSYRELAEKHRTRAVEYAKRVAQNRNEADPWSKKMEQYYLAIAKDAEALAIDVDKAADHIMIRAKELQGK